MYERDEEGNEEKLNRNEPNKGTHLLEKQWVFFFDDKNIVYYGVKSENF